MKQRAMNSLYLGIVAIFVTNAFAEEASAKKSIPFKGTFQAVEESVTVLPPEVPVPTLIVEASGSGRASHLGRYSVNYEFEVNLVTFFGFGSAEFVAANGDSIFTDTEGQGTVPTENGISWIVETHTISGGTGRFKNATGQFTLKRVINVFTGVTQGRFRGTIAKH